MIKLTMLSLDTSLFFIIALVWILMIVLNKVYYKPVREVIDQREGKISTETDQIEKMSREIEEKTGKIEDILKETKRDSVTIREGLIKEGERTREKIVTQARDDSKETFAKKMQELEEELAAAEKKLEKEIEVYSKKIKEIFI